MTRWFAIAIAVWLAANPHASTAHELTKLPDAAAGRTIFDARRHASRHVRHAPVRYAPRPDPRYLARPAYYRPYPYAVPAPFVFGFVRW